MVGPNGSGKTTKLSIATGCSRGLTVSYQPASRYWAFQWTETAIYLALALARYCFRRLSCRLS